MKLQGVKPGQVFYLITNNPRWEKVPIRVDSERNLIVVRSIPEDGIDKGNHVLISYDREVILIKKHRHRRH
jgi:hypothetical protein